MYLIPLALIIGAAVGLFVRGSTDYLLATRLVFWPIPVVGVALQALVGSGLGVPFPTLLTVISMALIATTCALNLHLTGASIVLIGTVMNLIPLVLNGYVPVTVDAVVGAGIADAGSIDLVRLSAIREFESGDEIFGFLGAIIPLSRVNEVFSFGDLIIACGLANLGFRAFFPLRETASYYDEALDYEQFRDGDQVDPFEGYDPTAAKWSANAESFDSHLYVDKAQESFLDIEDHDPTHRPSKET